MNSIAHITHNRSLGPPPSMSDGRCISLGIRDDTIAGEPCMVSHWRPTPGELKALNDGCVVALHIVGRVHPPVAVSVETAE